MSHMGVRTIATGWLMWAMLFFLAAAPATQPGKNLDQVCKDKGVVHVGSTVVAPEEAQVHDLVRGLRAAKAKLANEATARRNLDDKIQSATQVLNNMEARFEQINNQLIGMRNSAAKEELIEENNALLGPSKRQAQTIDDLKAQKQKLVDSRSVYVELALDGAVKADSASHAYDAVGKDLTLLGAIAQFNQTARFKVKLGPTSQFQDDLAFIKKCNAEVDTSDVPLVPGQSTPTVEVTLNNKLTKTMIWDSGASLVSLSSTTASALGLVPTAKDRKVELTIANGKKVRATLMTLDWVRVGKFTIANVPCVVMPVDASGEDLLGDTFQEHFLAKMDMGAGKLHLTPLDPQTQIPADKSASTSDKPAPAIPATHPAPVIADALVTVKYTTGKTEVDMLTEGAKYFTNKKYTIQNLPNELTGLTFTRRPGGNKSGAELDISPGALTFILCDSDTSASGGADELLKMLTDTGWTRLADAEYVVRDTKHCTIAVFKQTFAMQQHVKLSGANWAGIVVASKNLEVKQ